MGNKFKVMEMNVLFEVQRAFAEAMLSCSNKWKKHCHMVPCQRFDSSKESMVGRRCVLSAVIAAPFQQVQLASKSCTQIHFKVCAHCLNVARVQCLCCGNVAYSQQLP